MTKEYTYKQQGDGRDSWVVSEYEGEKLLNRYMVYENPNAEKKEPVPLTQAEADKLRELLK